VEIFDREFLVHKGERKNERSLEIEERIEKIGDRTFLFKLLG
jgi:hypothetical protein